MGRYKTISNIRRIKRELVPERRIQFQFIQEEKVRSHPSTEQQSLASPAADCTSEKLPSEWPTMALKNKQLRNRSTSSSIDIKIHTAHHNKSYHG